MSFQEQVDAIAVRLSAVSSQLAQGFDEVRGKISELEAAVASGGSADFSAVNAALDTVAGQAQSLDDIVPDTVVETGTTPSRVVTLRKCSDDLRPYFRIDGQIMSDSGGDVTAVVYRAKCNGDISGQFGDGKFFVTSANGIGLAVPGSRLLYDIVQHEGAYWLDTTPTAIPAMPPKNLSISSLAATTLTVNWNPVPGATGYKVEKAVSPFTTWTSAGTDPSTNTLAVITLTTATAYQFRVSTKVSALTSAPSSVIAVTTL